MKGRIIEYRGRHTILRKVGRFTWHLWIVGVTPARRPFVLRGTEHGARSRQKEEERRGNEGEQQAAHNRAGLKKVAAQHREGHHSGDYQTCPRCAAYRKPFE